MATLKNRARPDPGIRNGRPDSSIDPKNPWNRPLRKESESDTTEREREPDIKNEQPQENSPAGDSRRAVTNQDEQRKATNVDDNNNPNDEGSV